ncbi:MAG TPA: TetR/AcrR family transcriptional regulator [Ramlibacter sp.]
MDPTSTRERLLEAATRVFLERGFDAASMDLVRAEAGVSNGSLYHHFPTKAQLADALYADVLRDFHAVLLVPVSGRASARNGVKGMVRASIDWVVQHPARARLLDRLRRTGELAGGAGEWKVANAEGIAVLRAWVERKMADGELREMPFGVWVAIVFAPLVALSRQWLWDDPPVVPRKDAAALEQALWQAVAP